MRSSVGSTSGSMFGLDSIVQFDWRLAVGDLNISEEDFKRLAEQKKRLVQVNGSWVLLDPAMLEQIRTVMKRIQKKKGLSFREIMELHLHLPVPNHGCGADEQSRGKRFAPALRVHLHYGVRRSKGEAFKESIAGADVVITSYTLSHMDEEELASCEWSSLCLDEAQNIKNAYTKQASAIRKLKARHRIALTGTPIENRLTELWSIFDFINPGYLSSLSEFKRSFATAVEKGDPERSSVNQSCSFTVGCPRPNATRWLPGFKLGRAASSSFH